EIKKSFENNGQNIDLYYYRDARQHEIDLIYIKNASLHLIEIKCGMQFSLKDVESFKQITKSKYQIATKAIICSGDKLYNLDKETIVVPARTI
ncbi:MAG: DUF4143 domain-containing protein, partial [Mycoplasmoidaceae bacterium]|nr:DUF4143 domain-containing protein [Mycoplasmoidaceae bacterium]